MFHRKPVVAISCSSNNQPLDGSPARAIQNPIAYSNAIAAAGGIPLLCPECCVGEYLSLSDALLLSGGQDLSPSYYGEEAINDSVRCDPLRDRYEMELCQAFLSENKPILAICRGFQLLNVALGGTLYQDLNAQLGFVHFEPSIRHPFFAKPDSVLYRLYGEHFLVNSTHHQAVRELGEGLRVTGQSIEGIVESYESEDPNRLIWGTQFHPERLTGAQWDDRTPDFSRYFAAFLEEVGKRASANI